MSDTNRYLGVTSDTSFLELFPIHTTFICGFKYRQSPPVTERVAQPGFLGFCGETLTAQQHSSAGQGDASGRSGKRAGGSGGLVPGGTARCLPSPGAPRRLRALPSVKAHTAPRPRHGLRRAAGCLMAAGLLASRTWEL